MPTGCVQSPYDDTTIATNSQFTGAEWPPCKRCNTFLITIFQRCYIRCIRCINFYVIIDRGNCQFKYVWMPTHASNHTVLPISNNEKVWL